MRKNIIISGTTLWNLGDDFIREGCINIFNNLFPEGCNYFFYDFSPGRFIDYYSDSRKYNNGVGNLLYEKDFEQIKDHVDYILIPGIGSGFELMPLYDWIVKAGLQNKCVLIGGYYNNDYAKNCLNKEIMDGAKIVISRSPDLIDKNHIHLPCPSILSEEKTKKVSRKCPKDILFNIQISDTTINQHCSEKTFNCITREWKEINKEKYHTSILCHFKTEYLYFMKHRPIEDKNENSAVKLVDIIYNPFYNHLGEIYSKYDLIISTRLHSGLYAFSLGIPSIIVNDHFRHKETLKSIPCVHHVSPEDISPNVEDCLNAIAGFDLRVIEKEIKKFKEDLMDKYIKILREVLL